MQSDYKDKLRVIGIACNDNEAALRKTIKKFNIQWDNYMEENKLSFAYGVTGFPTKILIDLDGKILFRYDGEHKEFYEKILKYIK